MQIIIGQSLLIFRSCICTLQRSCYFVTDKEDFVQSLLKNKENDNSLNWYFNYI